MAFIKAWFYSQCGLASSDRGHLGYYLNAGHDSLREREEHLQCALVDSALCSYWTCGFRVLPSCPLLHPSPPVQFSCSVMSDSLRLHGLQHARPPCPSPTPRVYSNSCPLSLLYCPTTSPSVVPFPPTFNLSQHQGIFQWVNSSHHVAKGLEFQLQHQSFQSIFRTDFL